MGAERLVRAGEDEGLENLGNETADGALRAAGGWMGDDLSVSGGRETGAGISRSLKLPVREVVFDGKLDESLRFAILSRSVLLGGGAIGSGLFDGLTNGGGTRSRS